MFHLFILTTTANFPDVMMPGFKANRATFLFFLVFCVLMIFFMMPMLTAVIYSTYLQNHKKLQQRRLEVESDAETKAFNILQKDGAVSLDVIRALCYQVAAYRDIRHL